MSPHSSRSGPGVYELPASAVASLANLAGTRLVLHGIIFSHYVERARWTLRLLGIPFEEVNYMPLTHMVGILGLQRKFKQGPGAPTASSQSPAATPCLAIYSANGQKPLCLLQDSALICRYAVLRAAALNLPTASDLYGSPALTLTPPSGSSNGSSVSKVAGGDAAILELEARLGGTMGIETRRLAYHHLLPVAAGAALFTNNRTGSWLASRIIYCVCRLLLPKLLRVNAATAAKGKERLLAEFDYLDSLLLVQQQKQQGGSGAGDATAATAAASQAGSSPSKLPFYLLGKELSIADIQLACLAAPILCIPNELGTVWLPPTDTLPAELKTLVKALQQRPTGKFVLDMWRVHGPKVAAGAAANAKL